MVVADAFSLDSTASCVRCGVDVAFGEVDLSAGGFLSAWHVTGIDESSAGELVPVWCSCGWLSGAGDAEAARTLAREHSECPPRYEVRLIDAVRRTVDLRPEGWLASAGEIEVLLGLAERIRLELWSDAVRDVCVWDAETERVAWP
jgi:hypothetical protein